MIRYIVILLVFVVSLACDNNRVKKPKNLISESQMVDIIVDLAILNSAPGVDNSVLEKKGIVPESHVYKKYAIDSMQFVLSNNYYAHNIDSYQDIYRRVKTKLEAKKEEYKKLEQKEAKEKKTRDSIRAIEKRRNKPALIEADKSKVLEKISSPLKSVDSLPQ